MAKNKTTFQTKKHQSISLTQYLRRARFEWLDSMAKYEHFRYLWCHEKMCICVAPHLFDYQLCAFLGLDIYNSYLKERPIGAWIVDSPISSWANVYIVSRSAKFTDKAVQLRTLIRSEYILFLGFNILLIRCPEASVREMGGF